jgi:5-methyltetrahydropteroyltriglutamate--homocysteine methyltransferase
LFISLILLTINFPIQLELMFTTVIGSYPLKYDKLGKDAILQSVQDQLDAGIDLVSDGQTRYDMIQYFARTIEGYSFDAKSFINGKIGRGIPDIFVSDLEVVKTLTPHVKGTITGPVTLVFSSRIKAVYQGFRDERVYMDTAQALLEIAQALEKNGAEWINIDEPYLSVGAPMDIAKKAIESIALNLKVPVALHVCGKIVSIIDKLLDLQGVTLLSHGFMGEANTEVLNSPKLIASDKMLGLGCVDTKKSRVEDVEEIAGLIKTGLKTIPANRMAIHPDCGLRSLDRQIAFAKLKNMVLASKQAFQ